MAKATSSTTPETGSGDAAPIARTYGALTAPRGSLLAGQIVFVDGAAVDDPRLIGAAPVTPAQVEAAGHYLFPAPEA